ncbi:MAG: EscU/YscU/HrcU family type secretion system export apparatus switch protein [Actinomycetota bacterium]|nr:EscU/YscU/HrcU family type secretion system export apparatus switch protein [Actinomycetota bacterium]
MAKDGKTEDPTPRKIRNSRKEGQFPRTQDAGMWVGIATGGLMLPKSASYVIEHARNLLENLQAVADDPVRAQVLRVVEELPWTIVMACAPVGLAAAAGAVMATAAQGVHPTHKTLVPKFKRMSPKQGLKRMFGSRALWEAVKALAKVLVIGGVMVVLAQNVLPTLLGAPMPLPISLSQGRRALNLLLWTTVVTGIFIALADYAYQRRTVMKELRMTPREIKDEVKQTEGDPMIKGAVRARQMAISRNRMLSAVTDADVVVVNPTHFAVALKYEPGRGAPRVIAKGADSLAMKIRALAVKARVPVVQDRPLAQTLYRICDLDDEIPAELYLAVARILAFVMSAGRPSAHPGPIPHQRRSPRESDLPDLPTKVQMRVRRSRRSRGPRGPRK